MHSIKQKYRKARLFAAWHHGRSFILAAIFGAVGSTLPLYSLAAHASGTTDNIFSSTTVPTVVDSGDAHGVELGVKFKSDVTGTVTGVRFYKATANTGTHVGNLWSTSGTNLATATFTNETTSGWQNVTFASPVAIQANTTYVASYYTPTGHYSDMSNGFANNINNAPLHGLASAANGGNGVYKYGASSAFPASTYNATNYYVDVDFVPTPAQQFNCVSNPSGCGYPDATNTGVQAGQTLKTVTTTGANSSGPGWHYSASYGAVMVDGTNMTISNLYSAYPIYVIGSGNTLKNIKIMLNDPPSTSSGGGWAIGLYDRTASGWNADNTLIQNVEIGTPPCSDGGAYRQNNPACPNRIQVSIKDIYGNIRGVKIVNDNMYNMTVAVQIATFYAAYNYIHGFDVNCNLVSGQPPTGCNHDDGFYSSGNEGNPVTIVGNTVFNNLDQTDAVYISQILGCIVGNVNVSGNFLAGGDYAIYGGNDYVGTKNHSGQTCSEPHNMTFTNNRIGQQFFSAGGFYGPYSNVDKNASLNDTWSGNFWDSTGATIN